MERYPNKEIFFCCHMFTSVHGNFKIAFRQLQDTGSLWNSHGVNLKFIRTHHICISNMNLELYLGTPDLTIYFFSFLQVMLKALTSLLKSTQTRPHPMPSLVLQLRLLFQPFLLVFSILTPLHRKLLETSFAHRLFNLPSIHAIWPDQLPVNFVINLLMSRVY